MRASSLGSQHHRRLENMYMSAPINAWFKPTISVKHGEAEVRIPLRRDFHHAANAVHGSVYFKALDDATFFAVNSISEMFVLTAKFDLELLKPVVNGEIRAVGRVTEQGEKRILAEGEVYDSNNTIVARGKGSFARSKIPLTPAVGYVDITGSKL